MFVKITGSCPRCGLRKHQIDTSEEHAMQVLNDAFERHIREEHDPHFRSDKESRDA